MTILELLSQLRSLDIRIWVENGRLRVSAPDGVLTPTLRETLSTRKTEIIAFLQQAEMAKEATTTPIRPSVHADNVPLSFAQQRVWILDQLQMAAFSNMSAAVQITGPLDVKILERSLNEIVRRHEILRTKFVVKNGNPIQVVLPELSVTIDVDDLLPLPADTRKTEAQHAMALSAQMMFDLTNPPLFQIRLFLLDRDTFILFFNFHHMISDAWSQSVLVSELITLYQAFYNGRSASLAPPPIQYADFVVWQQQMLQSDKIKEAIHYWKTRLASPLPVLEMLTDQRQRNIGTAIKQSCTLEGQLTQSLKLLSQQEHVTLSTVLLAAFKTLLYRYTGQTDIIVGVPVFDRERTEVQQLIGLFLNTLVLRTDLSGNPTFLELLQRVHQTVSQAFLHKDLPFERLVAEIHPERNLTRNPLFQTTFVMQNVPPLSLEISGLQVSPFSIEMQQGMPPDVLGINIQDTDAGIICELEFNSNLLNHTVLEQFQTLLQGIVTNPQQRLTNLPLLMAAEQAQFDTQDRAVPDLQNEQGQCIHKLFERQVAQTPDAIAVILDEAQLTYEELNRRANKLAHYLRTFGVGPETLVGVCMERSLDMIIGILGILKAGGAYLPLDLAYPKDRLSYMLADSQTQVLLTQQQLLEKLPDMQLHLICIDKDWDLIAQANASNPELQVTSGNLAYSIYTSGSTGRPKGVLMPHEQVVRLFTATNDWFHFDANDIWTFFHSHAFDFSVWEIWGPLIYGGKLVIVPYLLSRAPDKLHALLCEENVTILNQTPSAFRQLVWAEEKEEPRMHLGLRLVVFGGEALDLSNLQPWFARHGDHLPQLVNMYGITETTVHVTYRPLATQDVDEAPGSVIGVPIPDLQLYILDKALHPVPVGVAGEMYVGGAGLARAYQNRPGLTAERFVPNPFSNKPGTRLYKSGDLACYLPDGDVMYLGRGDQQVKIRGFRIELGEIESVLNQHVGVQETAVLARAHESGEKQLVAYLVPTFPQHPPTVNEIRDFLKEMLPAYMVPVTFIMLESLPLTPNGKLDRRALPAPDLPSPLALKEDFVAPEGVVEERVASIWIKMLGIDKVSVYDTFFDLGGYSLLATQAIHEINEAFSVDLSLRDLFEEPTIAGLSLLIEEILLERFEESISTTAE